MKLNRIIYLSLRAIRRILYLFYKPTVLGVRTMIIKNKKILLVKHTYVPGWCMPGGGVNSAETTANAAKREAEEEAHIHITEAMTLLNIFYTDIHNRHDYVVLYLCTKFEEKKGHCQLEIQQKKWFPLNDLPPDTTPATLRRINEYLGKATVNGVW